MAILSRSREADNLADLRLSLARRAVLPLVALGWTVWYWQLASGQWNLRLAAVAAAAAGVCAALAHSARISPRWLVRTQALVLFLAVAVAYLVLGCDLAALFLALPALACSLAFSLGSALVLTVAGCAVVLVKPVADADWAAAVFVMLATNGVFSLLQCQETRAVLLQAWGLTARSYALANELALRQEEVNRLNNALKTSNGLLKRNLRELALAQRDAEEARHLKEQFANTVSHELRTPLSIMLGYLEVMQRYPEVYGDVNWTSGLRHDLNEIQASARYLSSLVDDLLDLARVQTLRLPLRREPSELAPIIQDAVELARRLLMAKPNVSITTHVSPACPELFMDKTRIRQVLINLLANACRFTEQGEIRVSASLAADEVIVTVADTGSGIPQDQIERIFGEFEQVHRGDGIRSEQAGRGLGLAIAKRFVQMHGGRIWAESPPAGGTAFHFSIPLAGKQIVALGQTVSLDADRSTDAPAVVVVGGDEETRFLSRNLERFRFVAAPDWADARAMVEETHPHAVIVSLPPSEVSAASAAVEPMLPEPVPVIRCALPSGAWARSSALFDLWLTKPVDSESLLQAIDRFGPARRILLVDDDRSLVGLLRRVLQTRSGALEVAWAYKGEEALAKAVAQRPDVVIVDIAMPGMNGWQLAERLRHSCGERRPAVIALSAVHPSETCAATGRSFSIWYGPGLEEGSVLRLLEACLTHLRPGYLPVPPSPEPAAEAPA